MAVVPSVVVAVVLIMIMPIIISIVIMAIVIIVALEDADCLRSHWLVGKRSPMGAFSWRPKTLVATSRRQGDGRA